MNGEEEPNLGPVAHETSVGEENVAAEPSYLDQALWRQMLDAVSMDAFANSWLSLQCAWIADVRRGVVVLGEADKGPFAPLAFWPRGKGGSLGLISVAEMALHERRGILRDPRQSGGQGGNASNACFLSYPIQTEGTLHGVVALELGLRPERELRGAMRQLQWGAAWIEVRLQREKLLSGPPSNQRTAKVLDLVATSLEHDQLNAAAMAVATELAAQMSCERVAIGLLREDQVEVLALSHSAQFSERAYLVETIGQAMDEALDQRCTLVYPPAEGGVPRIQRMHEKLSRSHGDTTVCTVPISHGDKVFGALTLERPRGNVFDGEAIQLSEAAASLIGPILELKHRDEEGLWPRMRSGVRGFAERLFGAEDYVLKAWAVLLTAVIVFLSFATGEYRVVADTRVEGAVQRAIVASMDGYVLDAPLRAGDKVREGDLIARLDDRDLLLERLKWQSQREQYLKQYRDALAKLGRAEVSVLRAQLGQAEAQLALTEEQLARTRVLAPFDGLIVSGDLSQSLGAPVARGDVLFEVAPLDAYRVILEVDDRDMLEIKTGQRGQLILTGRSDEILPISVEKITPVSESREGRNFFRVEAALEGSPPFLRPGMKGVGKITVGSKRLVWIWTHSFFDWLRLAVWSFVP